VGIGEIRYHTAYLARAGPRAIPGSRLTTHCQRDQTAHHHRTGAAGDPNSGRWGQNSAESDM